MIEDIKEPQIVPDFHVKLQSDNQPPMGEPGKSLAKEVELLRLQVADLCKAVRGLVQLQSVLNTGLQMLVKRDGGGSGATFEVIR